MCSLGAAPAQRGHSETSCPSPEAGAQWGALGTGAGTQHSQAGCMGGSHCKASPDQLPALRWRSHLFCTGHLLRQTALLPHPLQRGDTHSGDQLFNQNKEEVFPPTFQKTDFLEAVESREPPLPAPLLFSCVSLSKTLHVSEPFSR